MENDYTPGADPDEIKSFVRGLGLISADEYYAQVKAFLKKQRKSSQMTHEQIQRKLIENGIFKDASSKNAPLLFPRKRTAFSLVITRKRGKALKTRTPSASQTVTNTTILPTATIAVISPIDEKANEEDTIDYDQPLDLRLQSRSLNKS